MKRQIFAIALLLLISFQSSQKMVSAIRCLVVESIVVSYCHDTHQVLSCNIFGFTSAIETACRLMKILTDGMRLLQQLTTCWAPIYWVEIATTCGFIQKLLFTITWILWRLGYHITAPLLFEEKKFVFNLIISDSLFKPNRETEKDFFTRIIV